MEKEVDHSPAQRSRGRPGGGADEDVRSTILAVAEARFARAGYAATSIRQIAEEAGVNSAMIHYYFGSKESLLQAVMEKALAPLAKLIESLKSSDTAAPERITRELMSLVAAHPNLPYLVVREVMLPGGVMQQHFARHLAPRLGGALPGLLEREREQGRIGAELPPAHGAMAIMALALFPFIVRPVAEQVLDIRLSGESLDVFSSDIAEFVQRGFAS
jgi:AcrR family transcriptional regulator